MSVKNIKGLLIINWKSGAMRTAKRKPNKLNPTEILVNLDFDVEIPENPKHKITGKIELSKTEIKGLITDMLEQ